MARFKSPKGSPGHAVSIRIRGAMDFSFKVSVAGVSRSFKTRGAPDLLTYGGRWQMLFEPSIINRRIWQLAKAVIEFQDQFAREDYPYIYRERAGDLAARDGSLLKVLAQWDTLTVHEQDKLKSKLGEQVSGSVYRWQTLTQDLVTFSLNSAFSNSESSASRVADLLAGDPTDKENVRELDAAYAEYKKIYTRVYAPSKELQANNRGVYPW